MNSEKYKQCKSKDCNNPVLEGKYCNLCRQEKKENREKILKRAGAGAILVVGIVKNKDLIKQVPKTAEKVAKVIFKK
jgi:nitrogen regulatory protein PII-like uncharacterized protein